MQEDGEALDLRQGLAIASLVIGNISLIAWLVPICGAPLSISGAVIGYVGADSSRRIMAIAGIILACIGLFLSIVNAIAGAFLGVTG